VCVQCTYVLQKSFKAFTIYNFHKLKINISLKVFTILREKQNYYIYNLLSYFTRKGIQPITIAIYCNHTDEKILYIFILLLLKLEKCAIYHILSTWQWLIIIHYSSNSFH